MSLRLVFDRVANKKINILQFSFVQCGATHALIMEPSKKKLFR